MKKILLTFDVEEFDLPREFGNPLNKEQEFEISKQGLMRLRDLLTRHNIKSTFFTTANFAKEYPKIIRDLNKEGHEIACHGYCHSDCYVKNCSKIPIAKKEIEKIINQKVTGFRAPKWDLKNTKVIEQFGFVYDSSSHPIYLPGRYFNLNKKRKPHQINTLTEIPLSTLPPNFSIFWLAFKNFPLVYSKTFTKINFLNRNYTMLLFHPWEFTNISKFKLPWYINTIYGKKLLKKFEKYILFCKKNKYEFETVQDYLKLK